MKEKGWDKSLKLQQFAIVFAQEIIFVCLMSCGGNGNGSDMRNFWEKKIYAFVLPFWEEAVQKENIFSTKNEFKTIACGEIKELW